MKQIDTNKLVDQVRRFWYTKLDATRKENERKQLQKEALEEFKNLKIGTVAFRDEQNEVTATVVSPEKLVIDIDELAKRLTRVQLKSITKRVEYFDESLLEQSVANGVISVELVNEYTNVKQGTEYIKVTVNHKPEWE